MNTGRLLRISVNRVRILTLCVLLVAGCQHIDRGSESAAMKRYRTLWNETHDAENEFYTMFKYSAAEGLGFEEGVTRRDPSTVIKVGDKYYVWYTKSCGAPVGYDKATGESPATNWDLATIWYATSPDGRRWTEQGMAIGRGDKGSFDDRSVFTPDILVAEGKYYLYYQAVKAPYKRRTKDVIAMARADSPDGPWTKSAEPILKPGKSGQWLGQEDDRNKVKVRGAWDSLKVHDPCLIVRGGKYWLYYKGHPMGMRFGDVHGKKGIDFAMGVAIAERPEGPFIKSKLNPVTNSGHEVLVWPYKEGVATLVTRNGPEKNTVQFARDGLNFEIKSLVTITPHAAGAYRRDAFTDTKWGEGITWGLCHIESTSEGPYGFLIRFDCDLSLKEERPGFKRWPPRTKIETYFQKGNRLDKKTQPK